MSDDYKQTFLSVTFRMIKEEDKDHVCVCVCVDFGTCLHVCEAGPPSSTGVHKPSFYGMVSTCDRISRRHADTITLLQIHRQITFLKDILRGCPERQPDGAWKNPVPSFIFHL